MTRPNLRHAAAAVLMIGLAGTATVAQEARSGEDLMVENQIKVNVLFITAFRFEADRTELWRNGRLMSYRSQSHDGGIDIAVLEHTQLMDTKTGKFRRAG